jgi:hypothetical protein
VSDNPYQDQTDRNESGFLDGMGVSANLDGMVDYARNMKTVQGELQDHLQKLSTIEDGLRNAWGGGPIFPEGQFLVEMLTVCYARTVAYLSFLGQGVLNVGMAAQTVVDCYGGADGWSAADLSAVNFAFGGGTAPAGWPVSADDTSTYDDWFTQQHANDPPPGDPNQGATDDHWTDDTPVTNPDGSTTIVSRNWNHQTRSRTIRTLPDGTVETTYTFVNGQTMTTTDHPATTQQTPDGTQTVVTSSTQLGGKPSGSTTTTTLTSGGTTTVTRASYGGDGKPTETVVTVTRSDGSESVTTTEYDSDGKTTVTHLDVGTQTKPGHDPTANPVKDGADAVRDPANLWPTGG